MLPVPGKQGIEEKLQIWTTLRDSDATTEQQKKQLSALIKEGTGQLLTQQKEIKEKAVASLKERAVSELNSYKARKDRQGICLHKKFNKITKTVDSLLAGQFPSATQGHVACLPR